jgi:hypothetical protein
MKYIVIRDIGRTLAGMQLLELDAPPEQYKHLLLGPVDDPR